MPTWQHSPLVKQLVRRSNPNVGFLSGLSCRSSNLLGDFYPEGLRGKGYDHVNVRYNTDLEAVFTDSRFSPNHL